MGLLFLQPYVAIAKTGCYSLVQVLDILGFATINKVINGLNIIYLYISIYFLIMLFILVFSLVSSFALSKKLFFFLIFLYLIPALLQIFDLYTFKAYVEVYSFIPAKMGNVYGILVNSFLIIIFSWSLSTILLHIFRTEKKFKNFFDHIWYLFGLTALIFFIVNYDKEFTKKEIVDAQKVLSEQINILEKSFSDINIYCKKEIFYENFPSICEWKKPAYRYITSLDFFQENTILFEEESPTLEYIINISKTINKETLNLELNKLNAICNNKNIKDKCVKVPINFNRNYDFTTGRIKEYYMLPLKEIMPSIELEWQEVSRLQKEEKFIKIFPYYQWIFFMFLSFLIGIKIANSSRELFGGKLYSIYRTNLKKFFLSIIFFKCNKYHS